MATRDTRGFGNDEIEYLVHHAQQFHGPGDDFDLEVQRHVAGWDKPTAEDQQEAQEMQTHEALENLSVPENPVIPAPGSKSIPLRAPVMKDSTVPAVPGASNKGGGSVQIAGGNAVSQLPKTPLSKQKKPPFDTL